MNKSRDAGPQPLSEILDDLLKKRGLVKKVREHEIFLKWEYIVGSQIASNAVPKRFQGDTLVVAVKNHVWMNELKYLKPKLVEKIKEEFPDVRLKEIRLVIGTT